jgi:uncharacterized phage protein (TIGR01671 family)
MNREIKFRVFHKKEKQMIYWFTLSQSAWNTYISENATSLLYSILVSDKDSFEVMQYTGLKDKNGKEIYEFDIVKGGSRIMQIVWKKEACQFWLIWKDQISINRYEPLYANYGDDTDYFSNDSIEVIGNVFENPELLQQ